MTSDVIERLWSPMPPAPAAAPEVLVRVRRGARFPQVCPGCGARAEGTQTIDFEANPFVIGGGREELTVFFCNGCIALTRRRRRAMVIARAVVLVLTLSFIPLFDTAVTLVLGRNVAPPAVLRIGSAAVLLFGVLLLLRYVWIAAYRGWFFGVRIVGAEPEALVVAAHADYAPLIASPGEP